MTPEGLDISILGPALAAGLLVLATHVSLGQEVLKRGIIFIDLAKVRFDDLNRFEQAGELDGLRLYTAYEPQCAAYPSALPDLERNNPQACA